jgi:hypothetical protein
MGPDDSGPVSPMPVHATQCGYNCSANTSWQAKKLQKVTTQQAQLHHGGAGFKLGWLGRQGTSWLVELSHGDHGLQLVMAT